LDGSHQLALVLAGLFSFIQRMGRPHVRSATFLSIKKNFQSVLPAMLILFFVGMLIAAWASAGVLSTLIFLGMKLTSKEFFLPAITIVSGMAAIVSGSSWTTAGTIGVALMGVGQVFGFPLEVSAGAIVSGCYFGDKLSPLSDTTNLASSLAGVGLFVHIKHMMRTTIPSFLVCLFLYYIWNVYTLPGLTEPKFGSLSILQSNQLVYDLWNLLPVALVFGASMFGLHPLISLGLGIVSASILTYIRLPFVLVILQNLIFGFISDTGNKNLDVFLSGGGVSAIISTEALILSAVWFGGILEGMGYLQEILQKFKKWILVKSDVLLATMGSSFLLNLTTADQYLSLVIPARAFKHLATEYELDAKEVSRSLEDSGTISSPLVPWNSCGAFMATSLGVSTLSYLPYVWFNLIHILFAIFLVVIKRKKEISK